MRLNGAWEQPIVVTHPSDRFAADVADAIAHRFACAVRVTVGDATAREWGQGPAIYEVGPGG